MYWYRSSPFWLCLRYHISAASIFFLLHNHHFPWHPHHINNVSCLWADWNQDWHFSAEITWTFTSWYCHRWSWSHDGYEGKRQRLSIWRLMVGIWWILDYLKQNSGFKIFQGQATLIIWPGAMRGLPQLHAESYPIRPHMRTAPRSVAWE